MRCMQLRDGEPNWETVGETMPTFLQPVFRARSENSHLVTCQEMMPRYAENSFIGSILLESCLDYFIFRDRSNGDSKKKKMKGNFPQDLKIKKVHVQLIAPSPFTLPFTMGMAHF